jgi:hypothetical protein
MQVGSVIKYGLLIRDNQKGISESSDLNIGVTVAF